MSAHRCVGSGSRISGEDRVQNGGKAQKPTLHSCAGWLCTTVYMFGLLKHAVKVDIASPYTDQYQKPPFEHSRHLKITLASCSLSKVEA